MRDSPHETFNCPDIRASTSELAALGITVGDPSGQLLYHYDGPDLWVEIGMIAVFGDRIRAVPKADLPSVYLGRLIGAAEDAFRTRPRKASGWTHGYLRGVGSRWVSWISVRVESADAQAHAIHRARSVAEHRLPNLAAIA